MRDFGQTIYTNRFNRRHQLFGHLFSGRYKSLIIDERGGVGPIYWRVRDLPARNGSVDSVRHAAQRLGLAQQFLSGNEKVRGSVWC